MPGKLHMGGRATCDYPSTRERHPAPVLRWPGAPPVTRFPTPAVPAAGNFLRASSPPRKDFLP
jgi:hypothetical protein